MKLLAVLFVCVAFACAEEEVSSDELNASLANDDLILVEKVEKMCPNLGSKFQTPIGEVGICIEGIELGSNTFCQLLRKNFGKSFQPIRKVLIASLPEKSKGVPVLGEKIVMGILDHLCNSTVEEILVSFSSSNSRVNWCILKPFNSFIASLGPTNPTFHTYL